MRHDLHNFPVFIVLVLVLTDFSTHMNMAQLLYRVIKRGKVANGVARLVAALVRTGLAARASRTKCFSCNGRKDDSHAKDCAAVTR